MLPAAFGFVLIMWAAAAKKTLQNKILAVRLQLQLGAVAVVLVAAAAAAVAVATFKQHVVSESSLWPHVAQWHSTAK